MNTQKEIRSGLSFELVVAALGGGMANLPSSDMEDGTLDRFVEEHGLLHKPVLFVANHSIGEREWRGEAGRKPAFYPEPCFNGGWHIFTEEDVNFVRLVSATSGSSLTAEKSSEGTWTVTLEVPVMDDGQPYKGAYWASFHDASEPTS